MDDADISHIWLHKTTSWKFGKRIKCIHDVRSHDNKKIIYISQIYNTCIIGIKLKRLPQDYTDWKTLQKQIPLVNAFSAKYIAFGNSLKKKSHKIIKINIKVNK